MVQEITAYRADDGSIHPTKLAAAKHDAHCKLMQLDVFNVASANAVITNAEAVVNALLLYVNELEHQRATKELN